MNSLPDLVLIRSALRYDPDTGLLHWRHDRGKRTRAGAVAGSVNPKGYIQVGLDGSVIAGHRIAWFLQTGEWPEKVIDHVDRNRANNAWANLRLATNGENNANSKVSLGRWPWRGVWKDVRVKARPWRSGLTKDKKFVYLGSYDCPAAAHFYYLIGAAKHFGEFCPS